MGEGIIKTMIFNKNRKLQEWHRQGLISSDQLDQILAYESNPKNRTKNQRPWVLIGFLLLGGLLMGGGIISLVAANWQDITNGQKLLGAFTLLLLCGLALVESHHRQQRLIAETINVIYALLCLASIGLISQIYHTGGELYQALLLWASITVGLAFMTKHLLVTSLWVAGLILSLAITLAESPFWSDFFGSTDLGMLSLTMTLGLMAILARKFLADSPQTTSLRIGALVLALVTLLSMGSEPESSATVNWWAFILPLSMGLGMIALIFRKNTPYPTVIKGQLAAVLVLAAVPMGQPCKHNPDQRHTPSLAMSFTTF